MLDHAIQRFLVPPFLMLFLACLAIFFMEPFPSIPDWVTELSEFRSLLSIIIAFLATGTGLFAIGFLIANIPTFILRIVAMCLKRPRGFSTIWSNDSKKILKTIYDFKNDDIRLEAEQCEQCFIGDMASSHVLLWMRRRWEYFAVNSNSTVACLLAGLIIPLVASKFEHLINIWWYCIVGILILIFGFNGYQAWREAIDMANFLVQNYQNVLSLRKEGKMQNIETLIKLAEYIAKEKADGHLSMLKFTTGWKIFLGTPNLDIGEERERISELKAFPSLAEALASFVTEN